MSDETITEKVLKMSDEKAVHLLLNKMVVIATDKSVDALEMGADIEYKGKTRKVSLLLRIYDEDDSKTS